MLQNVTEPETAWLHKNSSWLTITTSTAFTAQEGVYDTVLAELRAGRKSSH